jgi:hypothetical protein
VEVPVHYWAERAEKEINIPIYLAERYQACLGELSK